jgi:hypothetical protein
MAGMDEDRKTGGRSPIFVAVVVIALLPIAYLASVGPAARLYHDGYLNEQLVTWLYAPIIYLEQHNEVCQQLIAWWVSLFDGK